MLTTRKAWLAMAGAVAFVGAGLMAPAIAAAATGDVSPGKALVKGHEYLVVANYPHLMHVIDAQDNSVYKTCALPGRYGPGTIAVSPDGSTAYELGNHYRVIYGVDLDSCKLVFQANLAQKPAQDARSMFSLEVSKDGSELYTVIAPVEKLIDRYKVEEPQFLVYKTNAGLEAKPVRSYPMPRQTTIMRAAEDGSVYIYGPSLYKMNVKTGELQDIFKIRDWPLKNYSSPDVLYVWPARDDVNHNFWVLYTAERYRDGKRDAAHTEAVYGYVSVNLKTGKVERKDFGPIVEIYFSATFAPQDRNTLYGVLSRLTKYDVKQQKLVKAVSLAHTYYEVTVSNDGKKLFLTSCFNDVSVRDANTLEEIQNIKLAGGDQAIGGAQIFIRG